MTEQRDPDWEGDQIPWNAWWYRNPLIRNITENGVTRQEVTPPPPMPGQPSAFIFEPDPGDFWSVKLKSLLDRTNSIMYPVIEVGIAAGIRVWGDGVRLYLPRIWMEDTEEFDLIVAIINGVNVSLQNRHILGY